MLNWLSSKFTRNVAFVFFFHFFIIDFGGLIIFLLYYADSFYIIVNDVYPANRHSVPILVFILFFMYVILKLGLIININKFAYIYAFIDIIILKVLLKFYLGSYVLGNFFFFIILRVLNKEEIFNVYSDLCNLKGIDADIEFFENFYKNLFSYDDSLAKVTSKLDFELDKLLNSLHKPEMVEPSFFQNVLNNYILPTGNYMIQHPLIVLSGVVIFSAACFFAYAYVNDINLFPSNNSSNTYITDDGVEVTKQSNGTEVLKLQDGTVITKNTELDRYIQEDPDGVITIQDYMRTSQYFKNGDHVSIFKDGSVLKYHNKIGLTSVQNTDGSIEVWGLNNVKYTITNSDFLILSRDPNSSFPSTSSNEVWDLKSGVGFLPHRSLEDIMVVIPRKTYIYYGPHFRDPRDALIMFHMNVSHHYENRQNVIDFAPTVYDVHRDWINRFYSNDYSDYYGDTPYDYEAFFLSKHPERAELISSYQVIEHWERDFLFQKENLQSMITEPLQGHLKSVDIAQEWGNFHDYPPPFRLSKFLNYLVGELS